MSSMFDLTGKTALVTGSGSGIGRALAQGLAAAGAAVVLTSRRGENLSQTLFAIESVGGSALAVPADLLESAQRDALLAQALAWRNGLDILVNCAGINFRGPTADFSTEDWRTILELDLTVPFLLSQRVGRAMIERGQGGSIINIASLCCSATRPQIAAYTAAKGGLAQLTKSLAVEWAQYGIRVNAIAPGFIDTEMTEPLIADAAFNDWVIAGTPAGRWGQPEDLVGPAVLLACDAGAFVTGQVIYVDGGFTVSM